MILEWMMPITTSQFYFLVSRVEACHELISIPIIK
jgi:hypothetical protein